MSLSYSGLGLRLGFSKLNNTSFMDTRVSCADGKLPRGAGEHVTANSEPVSPREQDGSCSGGSQGDSDAARNSLVS